MHARKLWKKATFIALTATLIVSAASTAETAKKLNSNPVETKTKQLAPQTICPVTGEAINPDLFVDVKGKRIYVCCEACIEPVKKDPEKFIKKLESMGQSVVSLKQDENKGKETKTDSVQPGIKDPEAKAAHTGYWTCPMHPEVQQAQPGNCPICGMKLNFKKGNKDLTKTKGMNHCQMNR